MFTFVNRHVFHLAIVTKLDGICGLLMGRKKLVHEERDMCAHKRTQSTHDEKSKLRDYERLN